MRQFTVILLFAFSLGTSPCFAQHPLDTNACYLVVEKMPAFPGCDSLSNDAKRNCAKSKLAQFLAPGIKKLADPSLRSVELLVQFTVETDGSIRQVELLKGDPIFAAAIKKMMEDGPKWSPGLQRDLPVKVQMRMPLKIEIK
ncbi:MAG: energy transducer TonB [Saprospiraceae bacterium]|nr:energy transducer TonB [Saprospiraceae bacterium]